MMRRLGYFSGVTALASALSACATAATPPASFRFSDIAANYLTYRSVASARTLIDANVPVGMPFADAISRLQGAGAHCEAYRHHAGVERCAYLASVPDENYVSAQLWQVLLTHDGDRVTAVSVSKI